MNDSRISLADVFAPLCLLLTSFIPMVLIGFLLDTLLVHFFSLAKDTATGLPAVSLWVFKNLAGYRFLTQEIMAGLWLLLVLFFIFNIFSSFNRQQIQLRFLYSFLFIWTTALTVAVFIVFACTQPYDLLLARIEDTNPLGVIFSKILIVEFALVLILPFALFAFNKAKAKNTTPSNF